MLSFALAVPGRAETPPSDAAIAGMLRVRVDGQKQATAIVVGLAEPGGNRVVAYGTTELHGSVPADGDTVFDVGSVTKVFTALLLEDMALGGKVSLDAPASKYLPDVALPSRNGRAITLADLATHTSGLPLRPTNLPSNNPANPYAGYTVQDLDAFLESYHLSRDPGSHYEYSNVGYGLAGQVLSAVSRKPYDKLLSERITGPLGMNDTAIVPTEEMASHAATGYDSQLRPVPHWDMGALASAGSLRSTANDQLKFLDAFLGLTPSPLRAAMDAMLTTRRPGGMPPSSAISFAWSILDDGVREIVWKNGNVGGFRAFIGFDRKRRLGIVALANAQTGNGADDIGLHLLDPAIPVDLDIPKTHIEIPLSEKVMDQFVGRYRFSATDILTVIRRGDHLYVIDWGQPPIEIYAETPTGFFLRVVNAQLGFAELRNGHAEKVIWHQAGTDQIGRRIGSQ